MVGGPSMGILRSFETTRIGVTASRFTSTFIVIAGPGWELAIKRAGQALSPARCICLRLPRPSKRSSSAKWPLSLKSLQEHEKQGRRLVARKGNEATYIKVARK